MSRPVRIAYPGAWYHVMNRGRRSDEVENFGAAGYLKGYRSCITRSLMIPPTLRCSTASAMLCFALQAQSGKHTCKTIREKLDGLEVSYPAQPHVTLAGLGKGTAVDAVRELVTDWAPSVPALHLDIEGVSIFPTPFQIVIVQICKTPDMFRAMSSLRERAQQRGLIDVATIAPADWIFHLSTAYCSFLSAASWTKVKRWVDTLVVPMVREVVSEAEIVAFDKLKF